MNKQEKPLVFHFSHITNDVVAAYEAEPFFSHSIGDIKIPYDDRLLHIPLNVSYVTALREPTYSKFKKFCIGIMAHQGSRCVHPLTCGIDSNHELLVPRIIVSDNMLVLVCPTCGYVQAAIPPQFRVED